MMKIDYSKVDSRLLDVSLEIYALEDHLQIIEKHMERFQEEERLRIDEYLKKESLCPDDPEWHIAFQDYNNRIDLLLPRLYRGSFLIALYAVYESAVTEIARLIQNKKSQKIAINDIKGDFLERAKKYFKHILTFDLYSEEKAWHKITMLSLLRDVYAHANGRLEMVKEPSRKTIQKWEQQNLGISDYHGYVICEAKIVEDIFKTVRKSLEDLVTRYKQWDDEQGVIFKNS
jgi:hypothetical protein